VDLDALVDSGKRGVGPREDPGIIKRLNDMLGRREHIEALKSKCFHCSLFCYMFLTSVFTRDELYAAHQRRRLPVLSQDFDGFDCSAPRESFPK
jgi:hypothetical protein